MTYNPNKNLLFIHIPKNAGKSIELALGFVNESELLLRKNRSLFNRSAKYILSKTANKNNFLKQHGTVDFSICSQHLTLQEITHLGFLSKAQLENCFSFAVHRNPWARALSTYNHFYPNNLFNKEQFNDFLSNWYDKNHMEHNKLAHSRPQLDFIRDIYGAINIDFLLCFERIDVDFKLLTDKLNLTDISLPFIGKGSFGADEYRYFYNHKARDLVAKRFECDVEYFEYSF